MPKNLSAWVDMAIFLAVYGVMVLVLAAFNLYMGVISLVVWICLAVFARERCRDRQEKFEQYCREVVCNVNTVFNYAIDHIPQAVLIVSADGRLQWSNPALYEFVGHVCDQGMLVSEFWPGMILKPVWGMTGEYIFTEGETSYKAMYRPIKLDDTEEDLMAFYVQDVTAVANLRKAYTDSRTVLSYIEIDNYDEVLQGLTEAERTALLFDVNRTVDDWMHKLGGFLRRVGDETYVAVLERSALEKAMQDKFDVLDRVRALHGSNKLPVTLSLGVAVADNQSLGELAMQAHSNLELALGRGGDQVAVQIDGKTQFFGGKTQAVEKHTRVKARVVAHALRDLIAKSGEVFVMGHQNEDFDALGAAFGVAKMVREGEKPVHIVLSDMNDGIDKLVDMLKEKPEYEKLFIKEPEALAMAPEKPLLIVVDTHIPHLVAAPKLLEKYKNVVVIDHHRRSESAIQNSVLMYIEPSSSSTSELVTELLMYLSNDLVLTRLEATALYSGIVVDTKNFGVQTGVRTFEAAAYLRRAGADPVVIRYLFRSDFDTSTTIAKATAAAQLYEGGLIVTTCPDPIPNVQAIAAQVADALLRIEAVRMSLVVFQLEENVVGISARSSGELNVQVIMEHFGGGGHQNVAGAQISGTSIADVEKEAVEIAKKYIEENG
ncbi:MAG: DHH family phosphoesterase [Schwartzia sp.]|nr:DHH family phosphoesterase [Schwartzia sp. (in: firmicutes)]